MHMIGMYLYQYRSLVNMTLSRGTLLVVDFSNLSEPLLSVLYPTLIVRCIADNPQISSTIQ